MPERSEDVIDGATHWHAAYRGRGVAGVSWFQSEPILSLELIDLMEIGPNTSVVDIGGGASSLVDNLLIRGFTDISVLDISETALEESHRRVGSAAPVNWLNDDLLTWRPARRFGLWHDRAVFHFLTGDADRRRYLKALRSGVEPGGSLIMATFAEDGPEYCSGLPVARYSAQGLLAILGSDFHLVDKLRELHTTPTGVIQPFTWIAARAATRPRPNTAG